MVNFVLGLTHDLLATIAKDREVLHILALELWVSRHLKLHTVVREQVCVDLRYNIVSELLILKLLDLLHDCLVFMGFFLSSVRSVRPAK